MESQIHGPEIILPTITIRINNLWPLNDVAVQSVIIPINNYKSTINRSISNQICVPKYIILISNTFKNKASPISKMRKN